jgi:hypothetical protein
MSSPDKKKRRIGELAKLLAAKLVENGMTPFSATSNGRTS